MTRKSFLLVGWLVGVLKVLERVKLSVYFFVYSLMCIKLRYQKCCVISQSTGCVYDVSLSLSFQVLSLFSCLVVVLCLDYTKEKGDMCQECS